MNEQARDRDPNVGRTLGRYRILEQIGSGGMGQVYRARDERLERDVALKVLHPGTLSDDDARKRFRREALSLSKLNHPNIATVHDFDTQEGVDFLVMECVAGTTLGEKLRAGPLPEREIAPLGVQLADGLEAAHRQRIIHRDLKPGNLRVTPDGLLKILDFGLARLAHPSTDTATTRSMEESHDRAGTLPYMAPEQLRGEPALETADVWAAGAVLYEMATGERAFPDTDSARLITAILTQAPPTPSGPNHRVSPELEAIITKCLEKGPERRYQSARDLAVDLRRLGTASEMKARRPRRAKRRSWWIAARGAALAVTLLAIAFGLDIGGVRKRLFASSDLIRSLAVLPLENLSGDPEQEYFVDGMTDQLTTDLAQIGSLKVISRTSAMQYKGVRRPLPQIARELGVDAVIEGSVLRVADRVRITAQLIRADTDRHLWAQSYERGLRDVLAMQGEIARTIAGEVQATLTPAVSRRLRSARSVDPEAYEAYAKGRHMLLSWTPEGEDSAIEFFQRAIAIDSTWAPPYAGLALAYQTLGQLGMASNIEMFPLARQAAQRAIALDEGTAEAHAALAYVALNFEWDWPAAERECRRALELNPNSLDALLAAAWFYTYLRRPQEALVVSQRALEVDPLSRPTNLHNGWVLYYASRYDDSVAQFKKALELDPKDGWAYAQLAWNYGQMGMRAEACAACEQALAAMPDDGLVLGSCGWVYGVVGERAKARLLLGRLKRLALVKPIDIYNVAWLYDGLGDAENAVKNLERAYTERSPSLPGMWCEFFSARLRSDPRFQDLLRRMKFPIE